MLFLILLSNLYQKKYDTFYSECLLSMYMSVAAVTVYVTSGNKTVTS